SDEYKALEATDPRRANAEGWFILDLYGAWRWRFLEASVSIQNLLNGSWREAQFGNRSCTRAETTDATNPSFPVCGATLPAAQRGGEGAARLVGLAAGEDRVAEAQLVQLQLDDAVEDRPALPGRGPVPLAAAQGAGEHGDEQAPPHRVKWTRIGGDSARTAR